jgi:DNA segregation ATPase FtsK/SpoIIIE, S-DNA-T family
LEADELAVDIIVDGDATAYALKVRPGATVRDLASALGISAVDPVLSVRRTSRLLLSDDELSVAQVVHGDELTLRRSLDEGTHWPGLSSDDAFRLVIDQGRQTGHIWPIPTDHVATFSLAPDVSGLKPESLVAEDATPTLPAGAFSIRSTDIDFVVRVDVSPGLEVLIDGVIARRGAGSAQLTIGSLCEIRAGELGPRVVFRLVEPTSPNAMVVPNVIRFQPLARDHEYDVPEPVIVKPDRKPELPRERGNWLTRMAIRELPIVGVYVLIFFLGGRSLFFLAFMILPIIRIAGRVWERRDDRHDLRNQIANWVINLDRDIAVIDAARQAEIDAVNSYHRSWPEIATDASESLAGLWQQSWTDATFGRLFIGLGPYETEHRIEIPGSDADPDLVDFRRRAEWARTDPEGPVVLALDEPVGLIAPSGLFAPIVRHCVSRLALTYSPSDVSMAVFLPGSGDSKLVEELDFVKWLPHVRQPTSFTSDSFRVYRSARRGNEVLAEVLNYFAGRRRAPRQSVLLIVHESSGVDRALLSAITELETDSISVVWIGQSTAVPLFIRSRVVFDIDADTALPHGEILPRRAHARTVVPEGVSADEARVAMRTIAPLVDMSGATVRAELPTLVPLGQVVSPTTTPTEHIEERWARSSTIGELRLTIGADDVGPLTLDLVADGPHALIGGTTDSGKSELLRSALSSAASRYAPNELALFLIDFKGGASLGDLARLPHTIGSATNLGGSNEITRVLAFLEAEVRHRESLLSPYQGEYPRYRRAGRRLPRLLVVVDEFAHFSDEKGAEQAMLGVASRGRSLGVHLVIATQRIQGTVSPQIRANVAARIALRTLDEADSTSVIDVPSAASIESHMKGRAFLRLSQKQLIEFQSAFSGSTYWAEGDSVDPVQVRAFNLRTEAPAAGADDELPRTSDLVSDFSYIERITSTLAGLRSAS